MVVYVWIFTIYVIHTKQLHYVDGQKWVCNLFCPSQCPSKRSKVLPVNGDGVLRCEQTLTMAFIFQTFPKSAYSAEYEGHPSLSRLKIFKFKCYGIIGTNVLLIYLCLRIYFLIDHKIVQSSQNFPIFPKKTEFAELSTGRFPDHSFS